MKTLSKKQTETLLREGYLLIPGLVPEAKVREARRAINLTLGRPQERGDAPDPVERCAALARTAPITDLFHKTSLRPLAQALLGKGKLNPETRNAVLVRFPQVPNWTERTSFHVDGLSEGHEDPGESHTLSAGVFLSDTPSPWMGNYALIPGSHAGRRGKPLQLTAKAGDAVLHHHRVAHSAFAFENRSPDIHYAAFFWIRHIDHEALKSKVAADLWLEWEGLKRG